MHFTSPENEHTFPGLCRKVCSPPPRVSSSAARHALAPTVIQVTAVFGVIYADEAPQNVSSLLPVVGSFFPATETSADPVTPSTSATSTSQCRGGGALSSRNS